MYLEAEKSLVHYGAYRNEPESDEHRKARELAEALGLPADNAGEGNYGSIEVVVHAGYWRKANHIHKWFVDNVQDGKDECQREYVSREDLKKLRDVCKLVADASELVDGEITNGYTLSADGGRNPIVEQGKVIANPAVAQELLPTTSGFFFGGTDYDEWYLRDVEHTIKVCEAALACPEDVDFYYHASW